ncbi:hypothetical protein T265_02237 [Opisthorchis viverrini]|uniref:Uncharacterized protein n=1 Tax=Opisthorchis viverrini TaxID=6198 RepID=A0A074ZWW1_OPIVI|nr:hypothetical protein T265_02237 [Opisthorchis viverrini]KER31601.1 hypothetical protein T265_02237 [Opisthorchis viverrini]
MYGDMSNIVATEHEAGLGHHIQLPENIINERFSWVPAVAPFRRLVATQPEGSTGAGILPGYLSLDRGSRGAEFGSESQTFRSVNSHSNHLGHLASDPYYKLRHTSLPYVI